MSRIGWYYLHENGSLIYKPEHDDTAADIRESDLARCMWPMDPNDREGAWNILVEGLALGADKARVSELAQKWSCDDRDADNYADRLGITLEIDGTAWRAKLQDFQNLQESPEGFGDSKLDAMADLARNLGLQAGKMWRTTFADICAGKASAA